MLCSIVPLAAQHQPYAELGITTEVLTLSNGKYQESFTNDTLVRIGSVLFNHITGEVVSIVLQDTTYEEYGLQADVASRFLSRDPLARDYPWYTPYQFAGNSPILNVDLDGAEPESAFSEYINQTRGHVIIVVQTADDTYLNKKLAEKGINRTGTYTIQSPPAGSSVFKIEYHSYNIDVKGYLTRKAWLAPQLAGFTQVFPPPPEPAEVFENIVIPDEVVTFDLTTIEIPPPPRPTAPPPPRVAEFDGKKITSGESFDTVAKFYGGGYKKVVNESSVLSQLKKIAEFMKENPGSTVTFYGNSDTDDWNKENVQIVGKKSVKGETETYGELADQRAKALRRVLMKKYKIKGSRIKTRRGKLKSKKTGSFKLRF